MLKVYFLGSGDIAVPVLKKLVEQSRAGLLELAGIGTQPDRPAGRKRVLMPTPVGKFAAENGLEIDKYVSLNDGTAQAKLSTLGLDFVVVVSYGQLLKKPLLELPRYGCVNVHASLLPRYRGASPIMHAIADMEKSFNGYHIADALECVLNLAKRSNKYIDETMPWALAKDAAKEARLGTVLYNLLESIRYIAVLISPFMPDTSKKILEQIGTDLGDYESLKEFGGIKAGAKVGTATPLFNRIDGEKLIEELVAQQNLRLKMLLKSVLMILLKLNLGLQRF